VQEPPRRVTKKKAGKKAEQKATAMGMHDGTASALREECGHSILADETAPRVHDTWRRTLSLKTMGNHDGTAPAQIEKCVQFLLAAETATMLLNTWGMAMGPEKAREASETWESHAATLKRALAFSHAGIGELATVEAQVSGTCECMLDIWHATFGWSATCVCA